MLRQGWLALANLSVEQDTYLSLFLNSTLPKQSRESRSFTNMSLASASNKASHSLCPMYKTVSVTTTLHFLLLFSIDSYLCILHCWETTLSTVCYYTANKRVLQGRIWLLCQLFTLHSDVSCIGKHIHYLFHVVDKKKEIFYILPLRMD